jgi:DNA polymerase-1
MKHLVLIDGHHLMYRAYYALPPTFKTKRGEQTNAVFGVASMILALLKAEEPDALLFCFDAGEETFRHQELETYKEGRAETPEEFSLQIPRIIEVIDAFSFAYVSDLQYEADDFLCSYARAAERAGMQVTVVTGDRDALQLASAKIRIAIPHKGYQKTEYLGPKEIEEKFGVTPGQITSYKGLIGDASDNLQGVRGIGPKTASELLRKYHSLEGIYAHLDEVKATIRGKLTQDREQAFFCARLAELVCDIPLPIPLKDLRLRSIPVEPALMLFQELEFTVLQKRLQEFCETPYGEKHFILSTEHGIAPPRGPLIEDQLPLFN